MWYKNIAGRFFGLVKKHAELNTTTTKRKLISLRSTKNYFLSAWAQMCYITDVNKTFHVVDICKF